MTVDKKIGVIGLGVMGKPMAHNLLAAGYEVTVHNRSQPAVEELEAAGAIPAASPAEIARTNDLVITMLPSDEEVEQVVAGERGILSEAKPGTIIIEMSTIHPSTAVELADAAERVDVDLLDAPVSGGEKGAIDGTLTIMVGGREEVFDAARECLEVVGANVVLVGVSGAGQVAKAANQIIVGATIAAVSEAFALAHHAGVDLAKLRAALLGGFATSRILDLHGQRMIDADFVPGFRSELHLKDLRIAEAAAGSVGLGAPTTELVRGFYEELVGAGGGSRDHSALYTLADGRTGSSHGATS